MKVNVNMNEKKNDLSTPIVNFYWRVGGHVSHRCHHLFVSLFQVTENIISKQTFIGESHTHTHTQTLTSQHKDVVPDFLFPFPPPLSEARTMPRNFNNTGTKFMTSVAQRPSAHLTLRDTGSQGEAAIIALG